MNKQMFHRFIDDCWDDWANRVDFDPNEEELKTKEEKPHADTIEEAVVEEKTEEKELPEGMRAVRTKSTGDKVYVLNEEKQTKRWVTSPEVLEGLGFTLGDVVEIDDLEFANYRLSVE